MVRTLSFGEGAKVTRDYKLQAVAALCRRYTFSGSVTATAYGSKSHRPCCNLFLCKPLLNPLQLLCDVAEAGT